MKNSDKIVCAFNFDISGTACNLDCSYCYRKGQGVVDRSVPAKFNYPIEHMLKALSRERLGGRAIICICGGGETLLPKETVPLIKGFLKEGHVVDLVSNLTLNHRIDELLETPREDLERLILKASFHYIELKRLNKLDDYFNNFNRLIKAGASGSPILTVCKEYIPLLDEIKQLCLDKINDLPHVTAEIDDFNTSMKPKDFYNDDFVAMIKEKFNSEIFETFSNLLKISPSEHFCYTGEWNFVIDSRTGDFRKCFYAPVEQNVFKNLDKPIIFEPIGYNCPKPNCALNYNWCSMGIMPSLKIKNYSQILFRPNTYNKEILKLLDFKFSDFRHEYTNKEKEKISQNVARKFAKLQKTKKKMSLKNKIRLNIYNYLKGKLESKGLI